MHKSKFKLSASGGSFVERAYQLFRHHCAVIAKRVRTNARCRNCFTHGWTKAPADSCPPGPRVGVRIGCDGCSEMNDFIHAARELFAHEHDADNGEGVRHG